MVKNDLSEDTCDMVAPHWRKLFEIQKAKNLEAKSKKRQEQLDLLQTAKDELNARANLANNFQNIKTICYTDVYDECEKNPGACLNIPLAYEITFFDVKEAKPVPLKNFREDFTEDDYRLEYLRTELEASQKEWSPRGTPTRVRLDVDAYSYNYKSDTFERSNFSSIYKSLKSISAPENNENFDYSIEACKKRVLSEVAKIKDFYLKNQGIKNKFGCSGEGRNFELIQVKDLSYIEGESSNDLPDITVQLQTVTELDGRQVKESFQTKPGAQLLAILGQYKWDEEYCLAAFKAYNSK